MSEAKLLLDGAREKLLDLTLRNSLLNYNVKKKGRLAIIDELPNILYSQLANGKAMKIFPVPYPEIDDQTESNEEVDERTGFINARAYAKRLGLNVDEEAPEHASEEAILEERHTDDAIQTLHYADALDTICRRLRANADSAIQETGTNLLYLAIGFLEWRPSRDRDRTVYSPLILMPVQIVRGSLDTEAGSYRYSIEYTGEDMLSNISLQYKMQREFGIVLPALVEEETPEQYYAKINHLCQNHPDLHGVRRRFALDFYHFSKLLMYLDLDPENWPENGNILDNDVLRQIAGDDPVPEVNGNGLGGEDPETTESLGLVMDADGSQRDAISQVLKGQNLIIEGPPGTGKSQTIANLIGVALAEGKSVLFVAEKLVALEVVKKRLDEVGLGHFVLELHSHKTNKLAFYTSLGDRVNLEFPAAQGELQRKIDEVGTIKANVNAYLETLHTPINGIVETPYNIFGHMLNIHRDSFEHLPTSEAYLKLKKESHEALSESLQALGKLIKEDPELLQSKWSGFQVTNAISIDAESIANLFKMLRNEFAKIDTIFKAQSLLRTVPCNDVNIGRIISLYESNELNYLPDTQKLKTIHHFGDERFLQTLDRAQNLNKLFEKIDDMDFEGVESLKELKTLGRTLRGFIDIGFFGKLFNGDYKRAKRQFLMTFTTKQKADPKTMGEEIDNLRKELESYIKALKEFYQLGGKELLESIGSNAIDSDTISSLPDSISGFDTIVDLKEVQEWKSRAYSAGLNDDMIEPLLGEQSSSYVSALQLVSTSIKEPLGRITKTLTEMQRFGNIDTERFYDEGDTYIQMSNAIEHKLSLTAILPMWIDASRLMQKIDEAELMSIVNFAANNQLLDQLKDLFEYGYYREWSHHVLRQSDTLAQFNRHLFETYLTQFRNADKKLASLYAKQHALILSKNDVPTGQGGNVGDMTEMRLIRNEVRKQRAHQPIRQTLKRASKAVRALKPCFMMSPLSLAQFIEPAEEKFDLMIMDEASQIFPEDALGAIARAKQVVVVGDPNQLPPSSFFHGMNDNEDTVETIATASESILDLMLRVYPNVKRLKWHYRSKHESLIAFSNHHFYDSELMIFPSPDGHDGNVGITRKFLPQAFYINQTNPDEAIAIVDGLFEYLQKSPTDSLGVVAMNKKQTELIERLIEQKTVDDAQLRHLYDDAFKQGRVFVKNLENVQGDEADILLISTTYGPDAEAKKVYQRFGPINGDHGWRRMNVLITRARKKIIVYTSMKSSDINPQEGNRGRMALRNYLSYIESGHIDDHTGITTGKEPDSPFEESVIRFIQSLGYIAKPQVGVAGFFIDIGVKLHNSYNFILGVECDGASYHSSRSARDRDRIRQEILESMGWNIYRIWSTDWFKHRTQEEDRLKNALENAKSRAVTIQDEPEEVVVQQEIAETRAAREEEEAVVKDEYEQNSELKEQLMRIRTGKIEPHFPVNSHSILSDRMIELFCKTQPTTMEEFRINTPQYLRENMDRNQMKFIEEIFETIEEHL